MTWVGGEETGPALVLLLKSYPKIIPERDTDLLLSLTTEYEIRTTLTNGTSSISFSWLFNFLKIIFVAKNTSVRYPLILAALHMQCFLSFFTG